MERGRQRAMDLGIDVGGTKTQGAFLRDGEVALTARVATPSDYEHLLVTLCALVAEAARVAGEPVTRLGIGVPGTAAGEHVTWVPNLPYLDGKELGVDLRTHAGVTAVVVGNDGQLALLGERWRGAARGAADVVLISVGTGVGGALCVNGKLVRGRHGSAGALGWLNLDRHAPPDPQHGYVELHGSGSALSDLGRMLTPPRSSYELVARARTGDPVACAAVGYVAEVLGAALASVASIVDPELIVFSGGLADAFDLFAGPIRESMRLRGSPSVRATPVVASALGVHASAWGALRAATLQMAAWE